MTEPQWAPPPPQAQPMAHRTAAIITIVGGAMVAVGSFLPWVTARTGFGSVSFSGTDGDGVITLIVGVAIGLGGLIHLDRPSPTQVRILIGAGALLVLAVFATGYMNVSERIASVDTGAIAVSVGAGLYIVGLGALVTLFGAFRMSPKT